MYYIKKFVILSQNEDGEKVISTLDLAPGLNIVYGPSNTGKSLVLDCVDFMLGGDAHRLYKPALRINTVTMYLDVDGAELSMYRELDEFKNHDIVVASRVPEIDTGTYTTGAKTKDKDTISSLWLKLMGIDQEVKIIKQIEDSMEQTLTVRTFYHFFVINENRISGENSILKPGSQTFTKNIPVPTITSLIYLTKELNYIAPADTPKTASKIIKLKRATAKNIVDGSVNAIREREATGVQDDPRSAAEIQTEINEILEQISAAEDSLKQTTDRDLKVTKKLIEISSAIAENTVLKNRYDALRTQYESDMRRLTFIAEADLHRDGIPKLDHCPFCNSELPKEKTQSCLDAAIAEADKIELRIKDLQYADEALTNELAQLQEQKEGLLREQQQVQAAIRGELRPQVEMLRDKLVMFTAALEKAKAKEMIRYFTEVLNDQLLRINEEDEFSADFDVRGKIREVLQAPLERLLTEILEKCNYDNYVGSRFDEDVCDVVVNGSEKMSQGQGFRAFLNTVMALAVQEMLNEFDLHMPHLLVMDSPILSLKEREEDVGTEVTSDSMRGGLFQYMIDHEKNRQTIVLENEIPPLDYSTANLIHFTRKPDRGRFGLIEGYRD